MADSFRPYLVAGAAALFLAGCGPSSAPRPGPDRPDVNEQAAETWNEVRAEDAIERSVRAQQAQRVQEDEQREAEERNAFDVELNAQHDAAFANTLATLNQTSPEDAAPIER